MQKSSMHYRRAPFLRATNFAKRAKAFLRENYFRGLMFSAQAGTYMIMINSCICYISVKQFSCKTESSRNPRKLWSSKKAPYGMRNSRLEYKVFVVCVHLAKSTL